jgi:antitoxin component YwqK of YwqJK toxin-antitoxin module
MGRIEKQKRELIEEANKRMLGEQESTDVGKKEEPVNQKDEQGNKTGLWVHEWNGKRREVYYKDGHWHGSFKQWHPNGKLSMEGETNNSGRIGVWKYYYDNGKLSKEGELKGDKRIGVWKYYDDNGKLKSETTYGDDSGYEWIESSRCWNENGLEIVCSSLRYKNTEILKKPYTFTDGKGKTYQGVVDGIGDDYTLEVAIDGMEHIVGGDGVLELYLDKKGKKWVITPDPVFAKKTRKEFLKFTNGGLIQDELLALTPWK